MINHTVKLLSLILGCYLGVFFSSQASAATIEVSASGVGTITLASSDDNLSITGTDGDVNYSLGTESGILSDVRGLSIIATGGNNVISVSNLGLAQNLTIRLADGADVITVTDSFAGGLLSIATRAGDDDVSVSNTAVVGSTSINTGGGNDEVTLFGLIAESALQVLTLGGDDSVIIELSELQRRANVSTAAGNDSIVMDSVRVESLMMIATSNGTDTITLNGNTFNSQLSVNTGAQNDQLIATGNSGSLRTTLDGSSGRNDVYQFDEANMFGSPFVFRGFEVEPISYAIGDTGPGGGIVFSVSADGTSGLEAAREDHSTGVQWCDSNTDIPGVENLGFDFSIPDPNLGAENTPRIIDVCGDSSAAGVAAAYVWPNGQTDGFLPNREELGLLFNQRTVVGGFANVGYWSSSEFDFNLVAWNQVFLGGIQGIIDKGTTLRVRAVRAF